MIDICITHNRMWALSKIFMWREYRHSFCMLGGVYYHNGQCGASRVDTSSDSLSDSPPPHHLRNIREYFICILYIGSEQNYGTIMMYWERRHSFICLSSVMTFSRMHGHPKIKNNTQNLSFTSVLRPRKRREMGNKFSFSQFWQGWGVFHLYNIYHAAEEEKKAGNIFKYKY